MKKIYLYMAALCLCITSCTDSEAPLQVSNMTGLWRVYQTNSGYKSSLPLWYRFSGDSIVEQYSYVGTEIKYVYSQGACTVSNDWLTMNFKKERIYMMNVVLRCVAEFSEPQPEWGSVKYLITSVGEDEIEATYENQKICFVRVNSLSLPWLDECSEPEMAATKQNLASQWDLRSFYSLDGNKYNARFLTTPETQGMTLLESGEFAAAQFWVNEIAVVERNAGRLLSSEGISVYYKDCAWSVKDDILFMVCVSYEKVKYDNSGNIISYTTVTPDEPIMVQFKIHTFTESWLTLYSPVDKFYFSFHRNTTAIKVSPARSSQSSHKQEWQKLSDKDEYLDASKIDLKNVIKKFE